MEKDPTKLPGTTDTSDPDSLLVSAPHLTREDLIKIHVLCTRFEQAWSSSRRESIEEIIAGTTHHHRAALVESLIRSEMEMRENGGSKLVLSELQTRFPQDMNAVRRALRPSAEIEHLDAAVYGPDSLNDFPVSAGEIALGSGDGNPKRVLSYFGNYDLLAEIARGGMGVVYRARQRSLNRPVAIKMILKGRLADASDVERFYREAQASATLDHPGIVPVYEVGEHDGQHFYSMALVEGMDLSRRLRDGPMSNKEAAKLLHAIAESVSYAHLQGLVHRDLKPSNILLDKDGCPHLVDFGLAKNLQSTSGLTATGQILGTPEYMAPEQITSGTEIVSPASDIYSLGAILYATLTDHPPHRGASVLETLRLVQHQPPVSPLAINPNVSRDLNTITLKCLEKAPHARYSSAKALADDLQRYLDGRPILARPISYLAKSVRWCRRNPTPSASAAIISCVIVVSGLLLWRSEASHRGQQDHLRIQGIVNSLQVADPAEIPILMSRLRSVDGRSTAVEVLRNTLANVSMDSPGYLRLALASAPEQAISSENFCHAVVRIDLREMGAIADWMPKADRELLEQLLPVITMQKPEANEIQSLRALVCLAQAKEWTILDDLAWKAKISEENWSMLVNELVREVVNQPSALQVATILTKGLRVSMLPSIQSVMLDAKESVRAHAAASLLAGWYADEPAALAVFATKCSNDETELFWDPLDNSREQATKVLRAIVESDPSGMAFVDRIALTRQQGVAATLLSRLGDYESLWPLLRFSTEPDLRYNTIHQWIRLQRDPNPLMRRISQLAEKLRSELDAPRNEVDVQGNLTSPIRCELRSLLLILGSVSKVLKVSNEGALRQFSDDVVTPLMQNDPDPGLFAAAHWFLSKSQRIPDSEIAFDASKLGNIDATRDWYMRPDGKPMAILRGPIEFLYGSDPSDTDRSSGIAIDPVTKETQSWNEERQIPVRIPRTFAISMLEATLEEINRCDPEFHSKVNQTLSPTLEHTANRLTWFQAARFCNFLSEQEGIVPSQWCFVPNDQGEYANGMKLAEDYLHRTGYRMPTEAEWEYACRAGTSERRFIGFGHEYLVAYARCSLNAEAQMMFAPGQLLPNDFGMFDIFGNSMEWCVNTGYLPGDLDSELPADLPILDAEQSLAINPEETRPLRGGTLYTDPNDLRASKRWTYRLYERDSRFGLRVARTIVLPK